MDLLTNSKDMISLSRYTCKFWISWWTRKIGSTWADVDANRTRTTGSDCTDVHANHGYVDEFRGHSGCVVDLIRPVRVDKLIIDQLTIQRTWFDCADVHAYHGYVDELARHDQTARMYTFIMDLLMNSKDIIWLRGGTQLSRIDEIKRHDQTARIYSLTMDLLTKLEDIIRLRALIHAYQEHVDEFWRHDQTVGMKSPIMGQARKTRLYCAGVHNYHGSVVEYERHNQTARINSLIMDLLTNSEI